MRKLTSILILLLAPACCAAQDEAAQPNAKVVVILGAEGSPEFGEQFRAWAETWRAAAGQGGAEFTLLGQDGADTTSDHDRLQQIAEQEKDAAESAPPLWLVFIGHGTFDGQLAKFNLRGPDVSSTELGEWLAPVKRPLAIIDCTAGSAPFLNHLSGKNRVIITATRSGNELNYAHFGEFLASAIADPTADLDKDAQVSLLEAYLTACRRLTEFYDQDSRLATEHPLIDDNGDSLGTPADWFRGLRATQRAKEGTSLDGTRAHQWHLVASDREKQIPAEIRQKRDAIELELEALRVQKSQFSEGDYYARLEPLMVDLAHVYQSIEVAAKSDADVEPKVDVEAEAKVK